MFNWIKILKNYKRIWMLETLWNTDIGVSIAEMEDGGLWMHGGNQNLFWFDGMPPQMSNIKIKKLIKSE